MRVKAHLNEKELAKNTIGELLTRRQGSMPRMDAISNDPQEYIQWKLSRFKKGVCKGYS